MYSGQNISVTVDSSGIAELVVDVHDSRVNIFNALTVSELSQAIHYLETASGIVGAVVLSGKDSFMAGADITEFASVFAEGSKKIAQLLDNSNDNFNRIEQLPFPVVAAINGVALGGGCEFILACDYRVAGEKGRIGLPETRLGIIPGWGGTVRLPRIAGIETAVEWITSGKNYPARVAQDKGVIDAVAEGDSFTLISVARQTLQACIEGRLDYAARRRQKQNPLQHNATESRLAFLTCLSMVSAQAGKHYPASITAVQLIEKGAALHFKDALALETQAFIDIAQTSTALALSGIFINDQLLAKKAKQWDKINHLPVKQAAVLGAGIMGGGIAYQSALKGIPVKMKDVAQSGIDLGLNEASKLLETQVSRGRLSVADMATVLQRITPCLDYNGFDQVNCVVEAVVENPDIKQSVLAEVEQRLRVDAILTSNTSTISINLLASGLQRPENFCGMHFFNPVHAMPLVEVICGANTSDSAIATAVGYATAMGKKAVVVNDCPGFLVNRVLFPYLAGFLMLLRDGVDFSRIDRVMEAWGWPMGPAYLLDVVGIDTAIHAADVMTKGFPSRMSYSFIPVTQRLLELERLGQKSKQGFYNYVKNKKGRWDKVASEDISDLISGYAENSSAASISDNDIVWRMMLPMATELARCLEEKVVGSVEEADMALVYGLGFPSFKGGVFRWMDEVGIDNICEKAKDYHYLGESYHPSEGMLVMQLSSLRYYSPKVLTPLNVTAGGHHE